MVKKIIKRDGRKKVFDPQKIEKAIYKAQLACGDDDVTLCKMITKLLIVLIKIMIIKIFRLKKCKILLKMF